MEPFLSMGRRKHPSDFGKGQIVRARRLDRSISETERLVDCSRSALVCTYRTIDKSKTGTRLTDVREHRRPSPLVRTDRNATVTEVAEDAHVYGRIVSQHTVHHTGIPIRLCNHRAVTVPMLTQVPPSKLLTMGMRAPKIDLKSNGRSSGLMSPVLFCIV